MHRQNSYLNYTQSQFIEELYEKFKQNPDSVDFGWKKFFEGMEFGMQNPDAATADPSALAGMDPVRPCMP